MILEEKNVFLVWSESYRTNGAQCIFRYVADSENELRIVVNRHYLLKPSCSYRCRVTTDVCIDSAGYEVSWNVLQKLRMWFQWIKMHCSHYSSLLTGINIVWWYHIQSGAVPLRTNDCGQGLSGGCDVIMILFGFFVVWRAENDLGSSHTTGFRYHKDRVQGEDLWQSAVGTNSGDPWPSSTSVSTFSLGVKYCRRR